jgi:hypothetical protein
MLLLVANSVPKAARDSQEQMLSIGPRSKWKAQMNFSLLWFLDKLAIGRRRNVHNLEQAIIPQGMALEPEASERPKALPRPRSR